MNWSALYAAFDSAAWVVEQMFRGSAGRLRVAASETIRVQNEVFGEPEEASAVTSRYIHHVAALGAEANLQRLGRPTSASALIRVRFVAGGNVRVAAGYQGPETTQPVVRVFDGALLSTRNPSAVLSVDAFEFVYAQIEKGRSHAFVVIGDTTVRRHVRMVAGSFPRANVAEHYSLGRLPSALTAAVDQAIATPLQEVVRTQLAEDPPMALPRKLVRVATDASMRRGRRGVGVACVSSDGRWRQKWLPRASDVNLGELEAIRLALLAFRHEDMVVVTDSRTALSWVESPGSAPSSFAVTCAHHIQQLASGRTVRFEWTRGHDRNELHNAADRLAVLCRRTHQFGLEDHPNDRIALNIVRTTVHPDALDPRDRRERSRTIEAKSA